MPFLFFVQLKSEIGDTNVATGKQLVDRAVLSAKESHTK